MKKVIVSFAHGAEYEEMLKIAYPTFYKYCIKYQHDLVIPSYEGVKVICKNFGWDYSRPISWLKVPIIKNLLYDFDYVLWIDCDVIITNKAPDIFKYTDKLVSQMFVIHRDLHEGFVPNCGVWLVSNNNIEFLDQIWNQSQYINHHWWEQMAVIDLMNWKPKAQDQSLSKYGINTIELPYEFNVHKNDIRFNNQSLENGYFLHATMWQNRTQTMKNWIKNYHNEL